MSDHEIAERIARYVRGEIAADDLALWLEQETWDAPSSAGADVLRLLAEADNGDWTEPELRIQLGRLVEQRPMGFVFGVAVIKPRFDERPVGIAIRRPSIAPDQLPQPTERSQSEPHSGIGIGERRPVQVQ